MYNQKEKFDNLFQGGHSPSSAYHSYRKALSDEYGREYVRISANKAINPSYKWVFYRISLFVHENFGKINSPEQGFRL